MQYAGNLFSVFFAEEPVRDFAGAQAAETFRYKPFFHAMLDAGVYLPPSAFEAWFVNAAMDDARAARIAGGAAGRRPGRGYCTPRPDDLLEAARSHRTS